VSELFLLKPHSRASRTAVKESGVRAYRESPTTVHLQIRLKGAKIGTVAAVSLTFDEARQLANHLLAEAS
jgi:hypothetical protein